MLKYNQVVYFRDNNSTIFKALFSEYWMYLAYIKIGTEQKLVNIDSLFSSRAELINSEIIEIKKVIERKQKFVNEWDDEKKLLEQKIIKLKKEK